VAFCQVRDKYRPCCRGFGRHKRAMMGGGGGDEDACCDQGYRSLPRVLGGRYDRHAIARNAR